MAQPLSIVMAIKCPYNKNVEIEFDPAKDHQNQRRHGLWLAEFPGFDAEPVVVSDNRRDYGEARFRAFGRISGQGYCLVFTWRGSRMRLISFRRSREKEMRRHGA